ncbi:MAG: hypothetical protein EOP04_30130 [Proteobacteria bacterium]|nr:MAG: hypothetical protein EOP04_30130 [Pseudomonadota bacterium]
MKLLYSWVTKTETTLLKIQVIIAAIFLTTSLSAFAQSPSPSAELIPGKQWGDVRIGASTKEIIKLKFEKMTEAQAGNLFRRGELTLRTEGDRVVEIAGSDKYKNISYQGKRLPEDTSEKSLTQFFSPCEKPSEGSGGKQIFCLAQSLSLTYGVSHEFQGISIFGSKTK